MLTAATPPQTYRSRSFKIVLGNGNAALRVNGRAKPVEQSAQALGYRITSRGRTALAPDQRPSCG